MTNDIIGLNSLYRIPGRLIFKEESGGLVFADVENEFAAGRIYLQGAQVTHFQPKDQDSVLWVSDSSLYETGKAIRGGIPVCWPWFGDHPSNGDKPAHGFARILPWKVLGAEETDSRETIIRLGLYDNKNTRAIWPYSFSLELNALLGKRLSVSLLIKNCGDKPFTCTGALHSYFNVGDSSRIQVLGLEGKDYLDKVDGFNRKHQEGQVVMEKEIDRIYLDVPGECFIEDPVMHRTIRIGKKGSNTTVVWNPGPEKSEKMDDMGGKAYRSMVCVETAKAANDAISLAPGETHLMETIFEIST